MINIQMKTEGSVDRNSILSINNKKVSKGIINSANIDILNRSVPNRENSVQHSSKNSIPNSSQSNNSSGVVAAPETMRIPQLLKPVQKGQKIGIENNVKLDSVKACFGWNTDNPNCDVDVSAFLLGENGKVLGDSWFVFYGQTKSPDSAVNFNIDSGEDRQNIIIDFKKLDANVKKIVFVLTINDAFEKKLHFGMLQDAYIRIFNGANLEEIVSFKMTDYYTNVISMMIGEVYQHNGAWKFNAVGNGVSRDLAGLCELYGVEIED